MRAVLQGALAYPLLRLSGIRPKLVQMGTGAEPVRVIVLDAPRKRGPWIAKVLTKVEKNAIASGKCADHDVRYEAGYVVRHDLRIDGRLAVRAVYR